MTQVVDVTTDNGKSFHSPAALCLTDLSLDVVHRLIKDVNYLQCKLSCALWQDT